MATVTTPVRSRNLAEAHQRVRSPLERLRSYIRTYVTLEGATVVGLYLALWFWIGLIFDYGFFRLFHVDWVQELPWVVRCGILVVLLSGLAAAVALKVFTRLFREFRDPALALVLERRYPNILGDRLITSVELADPKKAAEVGYSQAMIQETIHEAAQRVEQLKIKEVFDWERLTRRGILVGLLIFGGYLIAGTSFCTVNAIEKHGFTLAGFSQFNDVASIWFERNILLQNVIWPRKAHLEIIDIPASGEWRMGRGDKPPTIRVRAIKYVIAGAPKPQAVEIYRAWLESRNITGDEQDKLVQQFRQKPQEGWRALSWFDLTPKLLGAPVPDIALPTDWKVRSLATGLTLDEIELNLDKTETHTTLNADAKRGMRDVLERLDNRSADPAMSRTLRRLTIPDEVLLAYKGNNTNSQTTMQKLADNEYTGQFGDLKETVTFTVQGLDYFTASRKIMVVEPPALENLIREEERPAYLYYRLKRDDDPEVLTGKKQRFEEAKVSLQGGEVSRIDVPTGTNITLTATASKELQSATIVPHRTQKAGIPLTASPVEMLDSHTFRTSFQNVRFEQNFLFRFTDTDGVTGQRQVVIVPSEDAPPKIRELAPDDIVRKVQGGYLVTVTARIPFKGQVDDDHGLNEVRYAYTITRLESSRANRRVALLPLFGGFTLAPSGQDLLPALLDLAVTLKVATSAEQKTEDLPVDHYLLPLFKKKLEDRPDDAVLHPDTIREKLAQRQKEPYRALLRSFSIKGDEWTQPDLDPLQCDLPLWKTNSSLKVNDPLRPQPRYQMQLWLEAVDTDLDSEKYKDGRPKPHLKVSDEKFTFFVVSENELLTEIAKEEEKLYGDFDTMYQRLLESQSKLVQANLDLTSSALRVENLGPISARTDQINEVLETSQNATRGVYDAYARILREMLTNQVSQKFIDQVKNNIVEPLKNVDRTFDDTRDKVNAFRSALDNKEMTSVERIEASRKSGTTAKEQMRTLTVAIEKILASMQKMTDINGLIKQIAEIERDESSQYDTIKKINEELEDKIFGKAPGTGDKPDKK